MTTVASPPPIAAVYDALSVSDTAMLYMGTGVIGAVLYLLILLSYLYVPIIKTQHPGADIVIWQVFSGLMACIGFIVSYTSALPDTDQSESVFPRRTCTLLAVYTQFWVLSGSMWYLMLTLDLFVALVNPWMGYACKAWAYHTIAWSVSFVSSAVVYQQRAAGISSLNICWIKRTAEPHDVNRLHWIALFGPIIATVVISLAVLLFASFRFVRRQLDVTYRSKRRVLLQYYRYLFIYSGYWAACGMLYYADYHENFHGDMATRIQLALGIVYGSYPLLFLVVWLLNTELYQHRSRENTLTTAERDAEKIGKAEHFSAALRKDLMRYTTAGIRCSIDDKILGVSDPATAAAAAEGPGSRSPPPSSSRPRLDSVDSSIGYFSGDEGGGGAGGGGGPPGLYSEKKRLATTVFNGEYRYYEKLGFTDYAPKIFENIREACGIDNSRYEKSFAGTLLERATEGKSGMLFYFTSDRKYLVKTMTKKEHSFLLEILPLYHQYILKQPNTLLCRFLGCHSMQLPVGWNRMFFIVMENVFADGAVDERYDLKGIFHQTASAMGGGANVRGGGGGEMGSRRRLLDAAAFGTGEVEVEVDGDDDDDEYEEYDESTQTASSITDRYAYSGGDAAAGGCRPETQPLLVRRASSRSSLRHDSDFVGRRASLRVNSTTRANLLAQITNDCGFLQELGIMDYSFLLGVQKFDGRVDISTLSQLAHNAVVSEDQTKIYYLGFVDILQHYNFEWKLQHWILSTFLDRRKITALPPAEYGLRFLGFIHAYMLCDTERSLTRSYGSVKFSLV